MNPLALLAPFAGAFGLAIGSFLNVVAYRVPNDLSVVSPASACPGCHAEIQGRDNIPVVSWLMLRGRCRNCGMAISPRYPAIELLTGLAFVVVALFFAPAIFTAPTALAAAGHAVTLIALCYLAAISIALAAIDIDVQRLPDKIVLPSYLVGIVLLGTAGALAGDLTALLTAAIGGAAAYLFYFLLAFIYPAGMAFGDVKLAGVLGLFLGFLGVPQLVVGIAAGFVLGGLYGIGLLVARRAGRKSGIPFGPWMIAGAWVGALAGVPVAGLYLSLVGLA
jgi:leader peptidase (prepilin peptidase) / N-methyltransferase